MELIAGDIVTFLSKEEREAKYGTTSYGYPRNDEIIEHSGAVAGIIAEEAHLPEEYKVKLVGANKIWCALHQEYSINADSIKGVVGHIDGFDSTRAKFDLQYNNTIYDLLPPEIKIAAGTDIAVAQHPRPLYSTDVLKIACDMVDELGAKCIAARNVKNGEFDFDSSFLYDSNVCLEDGKIKSLTRARQSFDDITGDEPLDKRLERVRFTFGYNHLYAGEAALCILDMLEARYGLDFNELEKEFQRKAKKNYK